MANTPPAVYLVPHQDDDFLSMGADMKYHLLQGRTVEVFLYTNGQETYIKDKIGVSDEECTALRDEEFDHAMALMGVPKENVHKVLDPYYNARPTDFPTSGAAGRMLDWVFNYIKEKYPDSWQQASWKAMSWSDNHTGHAVMGEALRKKVAAGEITDARWFLKRDRWGEWPARPANTSKTVSTTITKETQPEAWYDLRAISYSYGIGNLSVPYEFGYMRDNMKSVVHDYVAS